MVETVVTSSGHLLNTDYSGTADEQKLCNKRLALPFSCLLNIITDKHLFRGNVSYNIPQVGIF